MFDATKQGGFGLIAGTVALSWIVHHIVIAGFIGAARKKYGVKYPDLYATSSNCKGDAKAVKKFNCIQRGHQNCLENQPIFLAMLLMSGTWYPVTAAIAGCSFLVGSVLYFFGYATGNPNGRQLGALPRYAGLFTLAGACIRIGIAALRARLEQ